MSPVAARDRRQAGQWVPWVVGVLTGASAAAHFILAVESTGVMAVFMLAGGLLCLWCTIHPLFQHHDLRRQAMMAMAISSSSALIHMGVITAHASSAGHRHGGPPQAMIDHGGHLQLMLGLVAFELLIVMVLAVIVRTQTDIRQLGPDQSAGSPDRPYAMSGTRVLGG